MHFPLKLLAMSAAIFLAVLTTTAAAQEPRSALNREQKNEVENIVREYLLTNPEIILEAIQKLRNRERSGQKARRQNTIASLKDEIENDPTSPVGGNPKGDVTIVEFFDYRCTFCKRVHPSLIKLLKQDKNIRFVYKEFPILTPGSEIAARAALVAWKYEKTKYVDFHNRLMATHGKLSKRRILSIAKKSGLDIARIEKEMQSPSIDKVLQRNFSLAEKLGFRGTPGFVIGTRVVPGAIDLATLKKLVAEARRG